MGGCCGGLIAAAIAFGPSFAFILLGASHFDRIRSDERVRAFLDDAGPAAIGAIGGSAVPLGLALTHAWQVVVLAIALLMLFAGRRGVVSTLLVCGAIGVVTSLVSS